jgi:hypothetical protein
VKEEGRVYVVLDPGITESNTDRTVGHDTDALIASLQEQVAYIREEMARREEIHVEESRRKDSIIAALTQRIPELEATERPQKVL